MGANAFVSGKMRSELPVSSTWIGVWIASGLECCPLQKTRYGRRLGTVGHNRPMFCFLTRSSGIPATACWSPLLVEAVYIGAQKYDDLGEVWLGR